MLSGPGKVDLLREHLQRYQLRTLVETGLWSGRGSGLGCLDLLDRYVVIDLEEANVSSVIETGIRNAFEAVEAGGHAPVANGFVGYVGDSGEWLRGALAYLDGPVLFWLDAHKLEEYDGEDSCPLLAELEAIVAWPEAPGSVVLIDDARLLDRSGFPSETEVYDLAMVGRSLWSTWVEEDDVIRLLP